MEYNQVDMDHPAVVAAVQNMVRQGEKTEKIMKVVGVPAEVVDRHRHAMPKDSK